MYRIALLALAVGLVWSLAGAPGDRRARASRFVLASFGSFALVSAMLWMIAPGGMARTVVAAGGGDLTLRIVQGRGAIVLPFGMAALLAAARPRWRPAMLVGPFAYNAAMAVEALRVQFGAIATPERWLYVALHGVWAIGLGACALPLFAVRRPIAGRAWPGLIAAGAIVAIGLALVLSPWAIVPGDPSADPLLFHSTRAFGSSVIGLGAAGVAIVAGRDGSWVDRLLVGLAAVLLAPFAAHAAAWPVLGPVLLPVMLLAAGLLLSAAPRGGEEAD